MEEDDGEKRNFNVITHLIAKEKRSPLFFFFFFPLSFFCFDLASTLSPPLLPSNNSLYVSAGIISVRFINVITAPDFRATE